MLFCKSKPRANRLESLLTVSRAEARGALAEFQSRSASQNTKFHNVLERLLRLRQV